MVIWLITVNPLFFKISVDWSLPDEKKPPETNPTAIKK
jgi:hypothetical protein